MFKRNLTAILVIAAMLFVIPDINFGEIAMQTKDFWLLLLSSLLLIACVVSIFVNEIKNK